MANLLVVIIIWIIGIGKFSWKYKESVAEFVVRRSPFRPIINYYLLITPLVMFEEFLTCETPYPACIPVTLPAFYILFFGLYVAMKRFKLDGRKATIYFGLFGWFNEFILVGRLFRYTFFENIVLGILVMPIYAVLAIIPTHYLEKSKGREV